MDEILKGNIAPGGIGQVRDIVEAELFRKHSEFRRARSGRARMMPPATADDHARNLAGVKELFQELYCKCMCYNNHDAWTIG